MFKHVTVGKARVKFNDVFPCSCFSILTLCMLAHCHTAVNVISTSCAFLKSDCLLWGEKKELLEQLHADSFQTAVEFSSAFSTEENNDNAKRVSSSHTGCLSVVKLILKLLVSTVCLPEPRRSSSTFSECYRLFYYQIIHCNCLTSLSCFTQSVPKPLIKP